MIEWIHPGLVVIIGALLIPFIPKGKVKQGYLLLLPLLAFIIIILTPEGTYGVISFMDEKIILGRVDKLAKCFAFIFALMLFMGMVFGLRQKEDGHHIAGFFYAGSAIGAVFAGDLLSFLCFWEIMAFASVYMVTIKKTKSSFKAAYRYILVHVAGGVILMFGILLYYFEHHTLAFNLMEFSGLSTGLILLGFAINAGFPMLGGWLPDAYPESTVPGGVLMATFTTKTAVYALVRGFAGTEILIWIGAIMAVYAVAYATVESDMRRLFSHHIMSQIGYMVVGIGIGTSLAVDGAVALGFTHILYMGLLFMASGSVIYVTGKRNLKDTGNLYHKMPLTLIFFMIGGFALSGAPLFAGFASKPMILSAAAAEHLTIPWILLMIAAAGTFLSTTLKMPYLVFFGKDKNKNLDVPKQEPPRNMMVGMTLAAIACIVVGVWPQGLYRLLPNGGNYHPYSISHVVWTVQLMLFTWFGFYLLLKMIKGKHMINLDFDWFYRKGGKLFLEVVAKMIVAPVDIVVSMIYIPLIIKPGKWIANNCFSFDYDVIDGVVRWVARSASGYSIWSSKQSLRFDQLIVDGLVNGIAGFMIGMSGALRRFQTGMVRDYAFAIIIGLVVLVNIFFFVIIR
ncbi:NADH-ubiquinone oxidoreductase chain L [hydrothermal vent metagenome]|uniref:NADH-ubiquinone oxidoreductase chain L n=1 Tax=hydrothermal vent metagenome TaxID=652676 RepID=A0A3B0V8X3_9ZZZZ